MPSNKCRQNFLNVAQAAKHHENKAVIVHKFAQKYRFKGSWDTTGKIVKERILNNELKYERCANEFDCYIKFQIDLARDGNEDKMKKLMQYENNKDARVLDNTIFICRRTHIGLATEHKEEYDALSSNPKP